MHSKIEEQSLIPVIREKRRYFEDHEYTSVLSIISSLSTKKAPHIEAGKTDREHICNEPKIEYVSQRTVHVNFDKPWLADMNDVELYIRALKEALIEEIRRGKRIQI